MPKPDFSRVPPFFHPYIKQVTEDDVLQALKNQAPSFIRFLTSIPAGKRNYRYAEGKWTLQEMLQHIIDTERIFAYRALCIARKEKASLPGFDEREYAAHSKASNRNWNNLIEEFAVVRDSTILLFQSFDAEQLESEGMASEKPIYVLGIGFTIAGHVNHHKNIIEDRYLAL